MFPLSDNLLVLNSCAAFSCHFGHIFREINYVQLFRVNYKPTSWIIGKGYFGQSLDYGELTQNASKLAFISLLWSSR